MIAVFLFLFQAHADKYQLKSGPVLCGYDPFEFSASNFTVTVKKAVRLQNAFLRQHLYRLRFLRYSEH